MPRKMSVEVGTNVYRDVTYAVEQIDGGARVTYAGAKVGPIDLWHPLIVDSDERAEDVVRLWAGWLYDEEKKKK
jgi:hypothetical protein